MRYEDAPEIIFVDVDKDLHLRSFANIQHEINVEKIIGAVREFPETVAYRKVKL